MSLDLLPHACSVFTWWCNLHFHLINLLSLRDQCDKPRWVVSTRDATAQSVHFLLATLLQQGREQTSTT